MNNLKFSLACLLAGGLILLAACCAGCSAPQQEAAAPPPLSGLSVQQADAMARERNLLYSYLPDAQSSEPITREQLCGMALQYTAAQRSIPYGALLDMTELYLADTDERGLLVCPYTDCGIDHYDNVWRVTAIAETLGLTDADGKTFRPTQPATRQEAAVILAAAYTGIGGTIPTDLPAPALSDWEDVAPDCRDAVAALLSWGVLADSEAGTFRPAEVYSMAQCVRDFLYLYENAPVSRARGGVAPMFSYQQVLAYYDALSSETAASGTGFSEKEVYFDARTAQTIQNGAAYQQGLFLEGPMAAVLRLDWGGSMQAVSRLMLIGKDGSIRGIDPGVFLRFHTLTPDLPLENPRFSADGKAFLFDLTIPEDALDRITLEEVSEAGTYHVTVDALTGDCTTERETASP